MRKKIISIALLLVATVGYAKDIKTVTVTTTPQMHCEACENKIKGNMRFEKGIKAIETNIEKQSVILKYDADKTTVEKLLKAFEKFGYKAEIKENGDDTKDSEPTKK